MVIRINILVIKGSCRLGYFVVETSSSRLIQIQIGQLGVLSSGSFLYFPINVVGFGDDSILVSEGFLEHVREGHRIRRVVNGLGVILIVIDVVLVDVELSLGSIFEEHDVGILQFITPIVLQLHCGVFEVYVMVSEVADHYISTVVVGDGVISTVRSLLGNLDLVVAAVEFRVNEGRSLLSIVEVVSSV